VPTIDEAITRVQAVTRDQVSQLYRAYLSSQAGELAIVGDFDLNTCLPILHDIFAGWTAAKPYARIASAAPAGLTGVQQQIKTPDKANATYTSGLVFPLRDDDPDYPALVIANVIYGSSTLASRLATRVRQHDGLSYDISSHFVASSFDPRATLTTTASANPHNMGKVIQAIAEEWARLLRDGVTADELRQATHGYLQARQAGRACLGRSTGQNARQPEPCRPDHDLHRRGGNKDRGPDARTGQCRCAQAPRFAGTRDRHGGGLRCTDCRRPAVAYKLASHIGAMKFSIYCDNLMRTGALHKQYYSKNSMAPI